MNTYSSLFYLVLNSINNFYIFQLDSEDKLIYKKYDFYYTLVEEDILTLDKVSNFSVALDNLDRINIVYLLETGELYHKILHDFEWIESPIGKYNTQSNRYNNFRIFFIGNKLNIIYSYSNIISSNIYTIQHIIYDQSVEEQHNVIKYVSSQMGDPFVVDYDDSGTIHLLYNTVTNRVSYIYHCFYSPYRNAWSINPKELSLNNETNIRPYIFIDLKSNIHSLWLEKKNNKYNLQYNVMPTKGKNQYNWNKINIPYSFSHYDTPILFEINDDIDIYYRSDNKNYILSKNSTDNLWIKEELSQEKYLLNVSISKEAFPNIKSTHIFGNLDDDPSIYLIDKIKSTIENLPMDIKPKSPKTEEVEDQSIQLSLSPEEQILQEVQTLRESQNNLKSLIDNLSIKNQEIENEINNLKKSFEENQSSFWRNLFGKY